MEVIRFQEVGFLFGERERFRFRFVYITCKKHGRKEEKALSLKQKIAGFCTSGGIDAGDSSSQETDTTDMPTEKQEPLLARLFEEFNISPSDYFNVDDDAITSGPASPPIVPAPSTSTAPETVTEDASDGDDDCEEEIPRISSKAVLDWVEKINTHCLQSGCADDVLESFHVFTRGWYRFYFQTGFLPVWGSKNRYKNRLTVNDEAPLV